MKILIDNGHGINTAGKRSPKWSETPQILEYEYTRRIAIELVRRLKSMNIDAERIVPEVEDISLNERSRRINHIAKIYGRKNTLAVSIHLNAHDKPKAKGWEVHTYLGQSVSDTYAKVFWDVAKSKLSTITIMRGDHSDGDPDFDSNFAILRDTVCPTLLTENLFMTNLEDCKYLNSEDGFKTIVDIHVEAIEKIIKLS